MDAIKRLAYLAEFARMGSLIKATQSFIAEYPDYLVSTSWGKDSVVLLHLCASVNPEIPVINARYPNSNERFSDMDRVRDEAIKHPDLQRIKYLEVSTPGEWEMYEMAGGGFSQAETTEQKAAAKWWKTNFDKNMRAARDGFGCTGAFIGLRAEESLARRVNVATHGKQYIKRNGDGIAMPLANWKGCHIWSYLVAHNLPWLTIYDAATCGRERARSGFVFATGGGGAIRRHGVWNDWKKVYPQEFYAWMKRFPELDK